MKFKKLLAFSLTLAMAFSMAACGSDKEEETADTGAEESQSAEKTETPDDEEVTLRFAWWGGDDRTEATMEVIEQFEEAHPNVTIEAEYGGSDGYHDKLSTQLAAGTAADIVQVDPETFPTYVEGGDYFIDFLEYDFDLSNFDEAYISSEINGRYDGKQLGLPTGIAGGCMLVNDGLAKEIGIDFTQDYTWDDLLEWGKKVREYDDSMYLICANKDYITNMVVYNYAKQLTGTTVFDKEEMKMNLTAEQLTEIFEYVQELYDSEVVAPASYSAAYSGDSLQTDPNWIDGKYVATFSYISTMEVMMAANTNITYSIGNLPMLENAKSDGWFANTPQVLAVTKTCEHPDVAVEFLDYFFNDETAMKTLACTRSVPPTQKAREICEADGTLNALVMEAADIASGMDGIASDSIASSQEGKQIMVDAVEEVSYGQTSPEDAAANAVSLLEGLL